MSNKMNHCAKVDVSIKYRKMWNPAGFKLGSSDRLEASWPPSHHDGPHGEKFIKTSVTRLDYSWKAFFKCSCKSSPNICWVLGIFEKCHDLCKNYSVYFLGNFCEKWATINSTIWSHWPQLLSTDFSLRVVSKIFFNAAIPGLFFVFSIGTTFYNSR